MRKKFSNNQGYSMIELLTVIGILGVIGVVVLSMVFISLRGTRKSDISEGLRQNGDAALSQIVKNIRFAKSIDSPVSCTPPITTSSLKVTSQSSNTSTTYSCSATSIASNGASLFNTSSVVVSGCSFRCSQQTLNDPPTVTIQFILSPISLGNFVETKTTIPFQSSVTLRNYSR